MIFESHAHYDAPCFENKLDGLFAELQPAGIAEIMTVGYDLASSKKSARISEKYRFVHASAGIHPLYLNGINESALDELVNMTKNHKLSAIGEIGLDYSGREDRDIQKKYFYEQLMIARKVSLPVILHVRKAGEDALKMLTGEDRGVIHGFSGSEETAKAYIKKGFKLGLGGAILAPGSRAAKAVSGIPLEHILVETDCPFCFGRPASIIGNNSHYLVVIVKKISEIHQISFERVAEKTFENSVSLFHAKK